MDGPTLRSTALLVGIGLVAGAVGTAVMTVSQKAEIALTGRPPSDVPARAIEKIGGIEISEGAPKAALATAAHLAFGTGLGLGLAALERVPGPARGALFLVGAWGAGTALITSLGLSAPPTRWRPAELAIDLGHHAVYAAAATAAFLGLRRLARVQPR